MTYMESWMACLQEKQDIKEVAGGGACADFLYALS